MSWVTVQVPADAVELACSEAALTAEGIEYFVLGRHFAALYPGTAIGGWNACRIQVRADDAARARALLARLAVPAQSAVRRQGGWRQRLSGLAGVLLGLAPGAGRR